MVDNNDTNIVIFSVSGRFPDSERVQEFQEKLFAKFNLLKDGSSRWTPATNSSLINVSIDFTNDEFKYVIDNNIDSRVLFPASGYLIAVWKFYAKRLNKNYLQLPVTFRNVCFNEITVVSKTETIKFDIGILMNSGRFEMYENNSLKVSGVITEINDNIEMLKSKLQTEQINECLKCTNEDIYTEFRLKGYYYGKSLQTIQEWDIKRQICLIKWNNNLATFIEALLQLTVFKMNSRKLLLPSFIQKFVIDPKIFLDFVDKRQQGSLHIPCYIYNKIDIIKTNGLKIQGWKFKSVATNTNKYLNVIYEKCVFVPYENKKMLANNYDDSLKQCLKVLIQIIYENNNNLAVIKVAEVAESCPIDKLLFNSFKNVVTYEPDISIEYTFVLNELEDVNKQEFDIDINLTNNLENKIFHVIIVHNMFRRQKNAEITKFLKKLSNKGMILLKEYKDNIELTEIDKLDLDIISKQLIGNNIFLLLRKRVTLTKNNIVIRITENDFFWVKLLKNKLKSINKDQRIYLISENPSSTGISGLTNCLRKESFGSNIRMFFLEDEQHEPFSLHSEFFAEQIKKDIILNFFKYGVWGSYRYLLLESTSAILTECAYIDVLQTRTLSSLNWIENSSTCDSNSNCDTYKIFYSCANEYDLMIIVGKSLKENCRLGFEFSGLNFKNQRVMGLTNGSTLATEVSSSNCKLIWEVPNNWTLEDAVTVPFAYSMASYALQLRGSIKNGESILIHSGATFVGLSAIIIALNMNCIVFITIDTETEKYFLLKSLSKYNINENFINLFNEDFQQLILKHTNNQGVDLILNSLNNPKYESICCLTEYGRFLNISNDNNNNLLLQTELLIKSNTYHCVSFNSLLNVNDVEQKMLHYFISNGIQDGTIVPLPRKVFLATEIKQAFEYLSRHLNFNKIVIKVRNENSEQLIPAIPRTYFNSEKSYLIIGELNTSAFELGKWLVSRGAMKLIFCSKNDTKTDYQSFCIEQWQEIGITVIMLTANLVSEIETKKLLNNCNNIGPVGAIFYVNFAKYNALMVDQNDDNFKLCFKEKINTVKNLDHVSRSMCPQLDYFVNWTNFSSGSGNKKQSNYGFANSTIVQILKFRKLAGYPSLTCETIDIEEEKLQNNETEKSGIRIDILLSCFQQMDVLFHHKESSTLLCARISDCEKQ